MPQHVTAGDQQEQHPPKKPPKCQNFFQTFDQVANKDAGRLSIPSGHLPLKQHKDSMPLYMAALRSSMDSGPSIEQGAGLLQPEMITVQDSQEDGYLCEQQADRD